MKHHKTKPETQTISWQAREFAEYRKSAGWYVGFTILSVLLMTFAVFSKSPLTIIAFAVMIASVFLFTRQKARFVTCSITPIGISVGKVVYPYKNIKTFWLFYNPPEIKTLNFETTAYLNNTVTVELGDQDPVAVKLLLNKYLVEDLEREESFSDVLARKTKF